MQQLAPIHRWALVIFVFAYVLIFLYRLVRVRGMFSYHLGPAFIGALGATAIVESAYPIYYVARHGSTQGVEGVYLYVIAGALVALTAGIAAIISGIKE